MRPKNRILVLLFWLICLENCSISVSSIQSCCGGREVYESGKCIPLRNGSDNLNTFFESNNMSSNLPDCIGGFKIVKLGLSQFVISKPEQEPEILEHNKTEFTNNGYFRHVREFYNPEEYCVARQENDSILLHVCKPRCSALNPCIPKCCPPGEVTDLNSTTFPGHICVKDDTLNWKPTLYENYKTKSINTEIIPIHFYLNQPDEWTAANRCKPVLYSHRGDFSFHFRVLSAGNVVVQQSRLEWIDPNWNKDEYCIDGAINLASERLDNCDISEMEESTILLLCIPHSFEATKINYPVIQTYYIAMIVAACFLAATLLVYVLLWSEQTLHGWTTMSYFASLLFMDVSLFAAFISSASLKKTGNNRLISIECQAIGIVSHFFFLSTFCWMTVLNFDLWSTFRNFKSIVSPTKGFHRYMTYFLFATVIPVIVVCLGLVLDLNYGDDLTVEILIPDYGKKRCYITPEALFPYLYGPIAVLLSINLILFTITLVSLQKIKRITSLAALNSTRNSSPFLILKLILLMGIPWTFEVISWAGGGQGDQRGNRVYWYWMTGDIFNILQAVAIFIIFVCKRDTANSLRTKYLVIDRVFSFFCKNSDSNYRSVNISNKSSTQSTGTGTQISKSSSISSGVFSSSLNCPELLIANNPISHLSSKL